MKNFSPRKGSLNFLRWLFIIAVYCVPFLAEAQEVFDLALTKQLSDGQSTQVSVGDQISYTVTVHNQGTLAADGITITDYLPLGTNLVSSNWSYNSGNMASYSFPSAASGSILQPGSSISVDIVLEVQQYTNPSIINLAEISSAIDENGNTEDDDSMFDNSNANDFVGGDNTIDDENGDEDDHDFAGIIVNEIPTIFDLSLEKELADGQSGVVYNGDFVNYTISISNEGNTAADNIIITDYLPDGTVLADDDWILNSNGSAYIMALSGSVLQPGASVSVDITLAVDDAGDGELINLAEISGATDGNGNQVTDMDSTPGNSIAGEDDYDDASVTVMTIPVTDCNNPLTCDPVTACVGGQETITICPSYCIAGNFQITEVHSTFNCSIVIQDDGCIKYTPLPGMDAVGFDYLTIVASNENGECVELVYNFTIGNCCTAYAGELDALDNNVCMGNTISAYPVINPVVPDGYVMEYVLSLGENHDIVATNELPEFFVEADGYYTIHTIVYDPAVFDISNYSNGIEIYNYFEGDNCGSFLLYGAGIWVEDCCFADVGTLVPTQETFCQYEKVKGELLETPTIPDGFVIRYILTDYLGNIIARKATPNFGYVDPGTYTIFTAVYDPTVLNLSTYTNIQTFMDEFIIPPAGFCGDITFNGATCVVEECCVANTGELDPLNNQVCTGEELVAYFVSDAVVPDGLNLVYVLTTGNGNIVGINSDPIFVGDIVGNYTIHSLIYDALTFDPTAYATGSEMSTYFENEPCGGFLVNGASISVEECVEPCTADVGVLIPVQPSFCDFDDVVAVITTEPVVPEGFHIRHILTDYLGNILQKKVNPNFGQLPPGTYTIFTVVYHSDDIGLGTYDNIQDLLDVFVGADSDFCGDITFNGATCVVDDCTPPCTPENIYACTGPVTPLVVCPEFCEIGSDYVFSEMHTTFECSLTDLGNGCIRYVPLPGFDGMEDQIEIIACNDAGVCETVYAYITVGDCDVDPPNPPNPPNPPCTADQDLCIATFATNTTPTQICLDFCNDGATIESIDATFDCVFEPTTEVCFEFLPLPGMFGQEVITVTACSGNGVCEDANVYVTISDDCSGNITSNNVPVAIDDNEWTNINTPVVIQVLSNDSDPDGDVFTICDYTLPANGTVVQIGNSFEYTPNQGYVGVDVFSYTICDGNGGSDDAAVYVDIQPATNQPPIAIDDFVETDYNDPIIINVLDNDSNPSGGDFYICSFEQPADGTVVETANGFEYTPNTNFSGIDVFTYTICNGNGGEDQGTVTINVLSCVSEMEVCRWPFSTSIEHTLICVDFCGDGYLVQDLDSYFQCSLSEPENNCFYYLPLPGFTGVDTVAVTGCNASGACETAYAYVNVTDNCSGVEVPVGNQPPVAENDTVILVGYSSMNLEVLWNDYDPDGDNFEICAITLPANGTISNLGGGLFTYYPSGSFEGVDAFSYSICDDFGNYDYGLVIIYGAEGKPANSTEQVMNMMSEDPEGTRIDFSSARNACLDHMQVPNVLTPNGDGINDVFRITDENNCLMLRQEVEFVVFDRMGSVVYQDRAYQSNLQWIPETNLPGDTYFYSLNVANENGKVNQIQGFIELRK